MKGKVMIMHKENNLDARVLVKQFGSPLYVYDAFKIMQNIKIFKEIPYNNKEICLQPCATTIRIS